MKYSSYYSNTWMKRCFTTNKSFYLPNNRVIHKASHAICAYPQYCIIKITEWGKHA